MHSSRSKTFLSQQAQLSLVGALTLLLVPIAGLLVGMTILHWLIFAIALSLVLWVGGAVSGQILLARLLDRDMTGAETSAYLRQLLWIIPRVYVPLGIIAVGCGILLVSMTGADPLSPAISIPFVLYAVTAVAGSVVSAPGYRNLLRANENGLSREDFRRKLLPLAWINRSELALVLSFGFVLLVSLLPTS